MRPVPVSVFVVDSRSDKMPSSVRIAALMSSNAVHMFVRTSSGVPPPNGSGSGSAGVSPRTPSRPAAPVAPAEVRPAPTATDAGTEAPAVTTAATPAGRNGTDDDERYLETSGVTAGLGAGCLHRGVRLAGDLADLLAGATKQLLLAAQAQAQDHGEGVQVVDRRVESRDVLLTDLMIPLTGSTSGSTSTSPTSLAERNEAAAAWCAEVNAAMYSEICAVPAERLVVEQPLRRPMYPDSR